MFQVRLACYPHACFGAGWICAGLSSYSSSGLSSPMAVDFEPLPLLLKPAVVGILGKTSLVADALDFDADRTYLLRAIQSGRWVQIGYPLCSSKYNNMLWCRDREMDFEKN
jgi:hypothetical protein